MMSSSRAALAVQLSDQLGLVVDAAVLDCWRTNYGLNKSPHELHAFWSDRAPSGAVLALRAAVAEIERLNVTLRNESRRVCGAEIDCVLQPHCSRAQKCMRPEWHSKA